MNTLDMIQESKRRGERVNGELEDILVVTIHDGQNMPITIAALMINPETGQYLAFDISQPARQATSYNSREEAIGFLVLDTK